MTTSIDHPTAFAIEQEVSKKGSLQSLILDFYFCYLFSWFLSRSCDFFSLYFSFPLPSESWNWKEGWRKIEARWWGGSGKASSISAAKVNRTAMAGRSRTLPSYIDWPLRSTDPPERGKLFRKAAASFCLRILFFFFTQRTKKRRVDMGGIARWSFYFPSLTSFTNLARYRSERFISPNFWIHWRPSSAIRKRILVSTTGVSILFSSQ